MPEESVVAVILAGGKSRRMGMSDKCFQTLAGRPLLDHVLDRLRPQVTHIVISANGDPARFGSWGLPVVSDVISGWKGPLVGILSAMEWASGEGASVPGLSDVVSVPADMPFLPPDLVARLLAGRRAARARAAIGVCNGRRNPVLGLWPLADAPSLRVAIEFDALAKAATWANRRGTVAVVFPDAKPDPFFNVNAPADLEMAECLIAGSANRTSGGIC